MHSLVWNVIGDGDNDSADGNSFYRNFMQGNGGDDALNGGQFNDTIEGNSGNDLLFGSTGVDSLNGGEGNDILSHNGNEPNEAGETYDGGADFDTLYLLGLDNPVHDFSDDTLISIEKVLMVDSDFGGQRTLILNAGQFGSGIAGNATIEFDTYDDNFETIRIAMNGATSLDLSGLSFAGETSTAHFEIGAGDDVTDSSVTGSSISDVIEGFGHETINGGGGRDTVTYANAVLAFGLILDGKNVFNIFGDVITDISNVENIIGSSLGDLISFQFNDGDNYIDGQSGSDNLSGFYGNDTIFGGEGGDFLFVSDGNDSISGDAGDDYIFAQSGGNSLDGGADADTLSYQYASGPVTVSLATAGPQNTGNGNDIILNFENLYGSSFGDNLTGSDGANLLFGNNGNDTIAGGAGNDLILAGGGVQVLDGGADIDTLSFDALVPGALNVSLAITGPQSVGTSSYTISNFENLFGSSSDDTLTGNSGNNVIDGGFSGSDTLDGSTGNDTLFGGVGDDRITSYDGNDSISGGSGFDFFEVSAGGNFLDGGADSDLLSYRNSSGPVTVSLAITGPQNTGNGNDIILNFENLYGSIFGDNLAGNDGGNFIDGSGGNDTVFGGAGNDFILARAGDESLDGGADIDTLSFALFSFSSGVNISLAVAGPQIFGGSSYTISNFEALIGSAQSDALTGNSGDNRLFGNMGNDSLSGGGGNDTLIGGAGNDVFDGGANNDVVDYSSANVGVRVDLSNAAAQNTNWGTDRFVSIETIIGSGFNDTLTGSTGANTLLGGAGNDSLVGGGGADSLDGGSGNDRMLGGALNDFYFVDSTGDIVTELAGEGTADTVRTTLNTYTTPSQVERIIFVGTGNFVGLGNSGANQINGNSGDDRFVDVLGGNDTISAGAGSDSMDFRSSATGAIINLATGVHGGAAAGDFYSSIEKFFGSNTQADTMTAGTGRANFSGFGGNDTLIGGNNIDALQGNAGNDSLDGAGGVDNLDGGAGDDTLTGGSGKDVFVFSAAGFGQDIITDFADGFDRLKVHSSIANNISAFNITGNGSTNVLLTQISSPTNTITLQSASAITITAADFLFY